MSQHTPGLVILISDWADLIGFIIDLLRGRW